MKYYHGEEQPPEGDRSPTRSVQTRASEKQVPATGLDGPKRRRTISASMREFLSLSLSSCCTSVPIEMAESDETGSAAIPTMLKPHACYATKSETLNHDIL